MRGVLVREEKVSEDEKLKSKVKKDDGVSVSKKSLKSG